MSKELEALERLAMPDELHISECKKTGIGLTEDYEVVKQALLELQYIKETKPSEALKELEGIEYVADVLKVNHKIGSRDIANQEIKEMVDRLNYRIPTIKQALIKAEKEHKALEIIKKKNVSVLGFRNRVFGYQKKQNGNITINDTYEYYLNNFGLYHNGFDSELLTKKEFNLLKEVLE